MTPSLVAPHIVDGTHTIINNKGIECAFCKSAKTFKKNE